MTGHPTGEAPIAVLAGSGTLPVELVRSLRQRGHAVRILAFRGFADDSLARRADSVRDLLDVSGTLETLRAWQPAAVTFAGTVHRPRPLAVIGALAALRNRDVVARLMASGDDSLLSAVIRVLEEQGFAVAGIDSLAPDLLAAAGPAGHLRPSADEQQSINIGMAALRALAPFDVGQAAVVCGARVAAIEGPEGTDAMLARVGLLWKTSRLRKLEPGGVLLKTAKATQDLRIDLPVIGPRTIKAAVAAHLSGIAIGAGRTLILDRDQTIAAADRHGLFLVGVADTQGEPEPA